MGSCLILLSFGSGFFFFYKRAGKCFLLERMEKKEFFLYISSINP